MLQIQIAADICWRQYTSLVPRQQEWQTEYVCIIAHAHYVLAPRHHTLAIPPYGRREKQSEVQSEQTDNSDNSSQQQKRIHTHK